MRAEVRAWAEAVLGAAITEVVELSGGITSTMVALTDASGQQSVLRLMTKDPWRAHGPDLTRRERAALQELATTSVPAPRSIGLDSEGAVAGVAMHLMSRLTGVPTTEVRDNDGTIPLMAEMLATIHDVRPVEPFRTFQSWAREAKWVVPPWAAHPKSWQRAFEVLGGKPPSYVPTFLHRDFSHRNLLWSAGGISGVVDWVETSTGPAWLDVGHAATNLAMEYGPEPAKAFLAHYAAVATEPRQDFWLVMDAVGFLAPPGEEPLSGHPPSCDGSTPGSTSCSARTVSDRSRGGVDGSGPGPVTAARRAGRARGHVALSRGPSGQTYKRRGLGGLRVARIVSDESGDGPRSAQVTDSSHFRSLT
jgi:aminoglycoside phosphotransferase (APT) family kinase protein